MTPKKAETSKKEKQEKAKSEKHQKLKILAAGDIHGDTNLVKKLAAQAEKENVDLVVLCGDITYAEQSTENIIGPFVKKNKQVLLIPGNHESLATTDFLCELYGIKNMHGYSVRYKDVGIFGCGGTTNVGPFQEVTEDEAHSLLKKSFDKVKYLKKKIMMTHIHPAGSKMERFSKFFEGSKGVRKAIEELKPDILLCSHVHEAEGIEEKIGKTKVINVGKNGKIIEL